MEAEPGKSILTEQWLQMIGGSEIKISGNFSN